MGEGETTQAVRRRLNAASEVLGKSLEVHRTANAVYFWSSEGWRRGRPGQHRGTVTTCGYGRGANRGRPE